MCTQDGIAWLQDDLAALAAEIYSTEEVTIIEAVHRAQLEFASTMVYAAEWDRQAVCCE